MTSQKKNSPELLKGLTAFFVVVQLASFFMFWVNWDGNTISGFSLPLGDFFKTSGEKFGLANPFPQFSFLFSVFWLIPILAILIMVLGFLKKKTVLLSFIAGALSLSLVTVYILFTNTLLELGVGTDLFGMLKSGIYLQALGAAGLIITAFPVKNFGSKIVWLLLGPVFAFASYKMGENYIMNETHTATENVKAEYTLTATDLLKEFIANDTSSNKKYLDKTMVVNGNVSAVDLLADSTSTIKFEDSTGSYIIFSLEKKEIEQIKNIKSGDPVSLKGVCSGSIFSEILSTTSISFKRATFNKK